MKRDPAPPTREAYLGGLPPERRAEVEQFDALVRVVVPELDPGYTPGFLGYGPYHYRYASGREGDTYIVSIASQKAHLSLYIAAADDEGYVAERYRDRFPKALVGRGCIRFKRLGDLDPEALAELLREASTKPMGAVV